MRIPDPIFRVYQEYMDGLLKSVLPLLDSETAAKLAEYLRRAEVGLYVIDPHIAAIPRAARHTWTLLGVGGIQIGKLYPAHVPAVAALLHCAHKKMCGIPLAVWLLWYEDYPWLCDLIDSVAQTHLGCALYAYVERQRHTYAQLFQAVRRLYKSRRRHGGTAPDTLGSSRSRHIKQHASGD